jgi:hypothetical protein
VKLPDPPSALIVIAATLAAFAALSRALYSIFLRLDWQRAAAVAYRVGGFMGKAQHAIEEAEAVIPKPPSPPMMPPAVTSLFLAFAFALGLGLVATCSIGCSGVKGEDVLKSSVDVRNQIAGVEIIAARDIHLRCTMPMEAIAALPAGPDRTEKEKTLARACDPLETSYDGERRSRMAFDEQTKSFASGNVTVGDILLSLQTLLADARSLEQEIAQ